MKFPGKSHFLLICPGSLSGVGSSEDETFQATTQNPDRQIDISNNVLLQGTFAATCATIVSGAIAERCHFNGYIIFSTVMTGLLYPIPVHWCWAEGGWLRELGFRDFAGSSVVHMSGGICALVGE